MRKSLKNNWKKRKKNKKKKKIKKKKMRRIRKTIYYQRRPQKLFKNKDLNG